MLSNIIARTKRLGSTSRLPRDDEWWVLSVTDNGGRTYQAIAELNGATWVGFTDFEVGYVITQNQNTQATALWRTTNAGATWSPVAVP